MTDPTPQTTKLENLIDDINKMSRDDQRFDNKDYETLRPGILKKLAALIHSEASRIALEAKISVLTELAHKTVPTDDDTHPEYTKGFVAMQAKVKFELQRLKKLKALTAPEGGNPSK